MLSLLRQGAYFANAGFWNCVGVGFLSAAALGLGSMCFYTEPMSYYMKTSILRRLMLLAAVLSSLVGALGLAYVLCDFCNFQLGIFHFGKLPWILGICISALLISLYVRLVLPRPVFGVLHGGTPASRKPVPRDNDLALMMATQALEYSEHAYARRCWHEVVKRLEAQKGADLKEHYGNLFVACHGLASEYWDGEHIRRDPEKAVLYAEKAMKHIRSANSAFISSYQSIEATGKDLDAVMAELDEQVSEFRLSYSIFLSDAIDLAEILARAYGAGDGAEKDAKKSAEYFAYKQILRSKLSGVDEFSATPQVTVRENAGSCEAGKKDEAFQFPYLIYDDLGRQWTFDWGNGQEARYTLDAVEDQKADLQDSLSGGVAYLKSSDMAGGRASCWGRTFHW